MISFFDSLFGVFFSSYYFGSMLNLCAFFMIAALGFMALIKCGEFNLGGEGQIYLGGFVCAVFLSKVEFLPSFLALTFAFLISFFASSILGLISALLKKFKNADFMLTSFVTSQAIIPLIDSLVSGPFRTKNGNLLATPFILQKFRFTRILLPSNLSPVIFFCILLCILAFLFYKNTTFGKNIRVFGKSREFALYSGLSENKILFFSSIVSSGLCGLCGAFLICGNYYACHSGFYSGIGWNSLSASMIANSNPLLIIPSSLFMSYLITSAQRITMIKNFPFDISSLVQAVVLFIIAFPYARKKNVDF